MGKFNPETDLPKNYELVGMSPIPSGELEKLRELFRIRLDAMTRFDEMQKGAFALQRQFNQADKVLDGRLIEFCWKNGWDTHTGVAFDEIDGKIYAFKPKANGGNPTPPGAEDEEHHHHS